MIPTKKDIVYERVPTNDFVNGRIIDIQHEENHTFKIKGGEEVKAGVRLKFLIQGLKYPKYTRWMTLTYDKRSNLFDKYLKSLVAGAKEYMEYDLERLLGVKVKMIWKFTDPEQKYQAVDIIRPADGNLLPLIVGPMDPAELEAIKKELEPLNQRVQDNLEKTSEEVPF